MYDEECRNHTRGLCRFRHSVRYVEPVREEAVFVDPVVIEKPKPVKKSTKVTQVIQTYTKKGVAPTITFTYAPETKTR